MIKANRGMDQNRVVHQNNENCQALQRKVGVERQKRLIPVSAYAPNACELKAEE